MLLTLAVLMNQQEWYIHIVYLNRSLIMHDIDCHKYIVDREYTDLSLKTIGWQTYRRMCLIMRLSQFFVTERMKKRSTSIVHTMQWLIILDDTTSGQKPWNIINTFCDFMNHRAGSCAIDFWKCFGTK